MARRFLRALANIVMVFVIASAIIGLSFCVLLTPPATTVFATLFSDESGTGRTHVQIVEVAQQVREFSMGTGAPEFPQSIEDTPQAIGADAVQHLIDCRPVFRSGKYFGLITALVFVIVLLACILTRKKKRLGKIMIAGGIVALAATICLAAAAVIDFDAFFGWLHGFFFEGESWLFPADCLLIKALPEKFWAAMGVLWGVCILLLSLFCLLLGNRFRKSSR